MLRVQKIDDLRNVPATQMVAAQPAAEDRYAPCLDRVNAPCPRKRRESHASPERRVGEEK